MREELILVLKALQWEKCKGALAGLAALEGSHKSTHELDNWKKLNILISDFIQEVENEGYQE